jgi:hypothetical protein
MKPTLLDVNVLVALFDPAHPNLPQCGGDRGRGDFPAACLVREPLAPVLA